MAQLQQSHLMNFTAQPMGRVISGNAVQSNSIVAITNAGGKLGAGGAEGGPNDYKPAGAPDTPNESFAAAAADVLESENAAVEQGGSDFTDNVPGGLQQILDDNALLPGGFIQYRERDFFARQLQYNTLTQGGTFDTDLLELPNASIFNIANMGQLPSGLNGFTLFDFTKFTDSYSATSKFSLP